MTIHDPNQKISRKRAQWLANAKQSAASISRNWYNWYEIEGNTLNKMTLTEVWNGDDDYPLTPICIEQFDIVDDVETIRKYVDTHDKRELFSLI